MNAGMKQPLVSICCITYNHSEYIRQCLDGFLMQRTSFSYEIIINDDCSTDGTTDIIREYEERYPTQIVPIYHVENEYSKGVRGMFATYCFPKAKGKYIAMCEGDDYWIDPLKLQKQVDFMEANPEVDLVWTRAKCYGQSKNAYLYELGEKALSFDDLLQKNTIPTLTVAFRKSAIDGFQAVLEGKTWRMGDYPLWLYISLGGRIHFLDEVTSVYRYLDESASHSKSYESAKKFRESAYEIRKYFSKYSKKANISQILLSEYNHICFCLAFQYKEHSDVVTFYKELNPQSLTMKDRLKYMISRIALVF